MLISRLFFLVLSLIFLSSCTATNQSIPRTSFLENQTDPALSGNGEKIAFITNWGRKPTVLLKNVKTGKLFSLFHLSKYQPHSSPSLSWSGRYLAVIGQIGKQKTVIIEDRMKGKMHKLVIPKGGIPSQISLSPDARKLAIQTLDSGKSKLHLYDLTNRMEPDLFIRINR